MPCKPNANGPMWFGPGLFSTIAFSLTVAANSGCKFVSVDNDLSQGASYPSALMVASIGVKSIGLWCFEDSFGNTYSTNDLEGDSKFEAARGLGTTASVLGFILWVVYLVAGCVRFPPMGFKLAGVSAVLIAMFQGLVFLVYKAQICDVYSCSLDTGGKCAISSVVFWFICGLLSCAVGEEHGGKQADQPKKDPKEVINVETPDDEEAKVGGVDEADEE
jgi:hypothetical protein